MTKAAFYAAAASTQALTKTTTSASSSPNSPAGPGGRCNCGDAEAWHSNIQRPFHPLLHDSDRCFDSALSTPDTTPRVPPKSISKADIPPIPHYPFRTAFPPELRETWVAPLIFFSKPSTALQRKPIFAFSPQPTPCKRINAPSSSGMTTHVPSTKSSSSSAT